MAKKTQPTWPTNIAILLLLATPVMTLLSYGAAVCQPHQQWYGTIFSFIYGAGALFLLNEGLRSLLPERFKSINFLALAGMAATFTYFTTVYVYAYIIFAIFTIFFMIRTLNCLHLLRQKKAANN